MQADYRSKQFYEILEIINSVLVKYNLDPITSEDGKISTSKFNVGSHGTKTIWRITNKTCPRLLNSAVMREIKNAVTDRFPEYIRDKTITFGIPSYTKTTSGDPLASIVILVAELTDNIITNESTLRECLEIESRMYRDDTDNRDPLTRIEDFIYSLTYEPQLVEANLKRITDLKLKHSTDFITIEPDKETDFFGSVDGIACNVEGKSTKVNINYEDTDVGHLEFAEYFKKRVDSKSFGNLHNADYVLLVVKPTRDVIGVSTKDYTDNWLAGKI